MKHMGLYSYSKRKYGFVCVAGKRAGLINPRSKLYPLFTKPDMFYMFSADWCNKN